MTEVSKQAKTLYYLDMHKAEQLKPKPKPSDIDIRVEEAVVKQYQLNRFLYQLVGEPWQWTDKLNHSDEQWKALVENDNHRTWLATVKGNIAGYFELQQINGNTEIHYFGLTPAFLGKGLGGYLLSYAIEQAWQWQGTKRVWVNTCSFDHPSALANYKARGMVEYDKVVEQPQTPASLATPAFTIRSYQASDQDSVVALWQACNLTVPWNDPSKDIQRKLKVGADLFLVAEAGDQLVATAMGGYEGHRGWVNYLAVSPDHQRKGYGQQIMRYLEERLKEQGCPKLNLQVRQSNDAVIRFYQALGYSDDKVLGMGKRLIADD